MPKNVQEELVSRIRACRRCRDDPSGPALPHEPRPVLRVSTSARIAVCGQAPGTRVHASGVPFSDASGDRLRSWMGVSEAEFYDVSRIAFVPMGFCFPGQDAKGADLPPRRECAPLWRNEVFGTLQHLQLVLLVGRHAQVWHLGRAATVNGLTQTVAGWRSMTSGSSGSAMLALPHPSWRNSGWLKRQPWFEADLLPVLRQRVRDLL